MFSNGNIFFLFLFLIPQNKVCPFQLYIDSEKAHLFTSFDAEVIPYQKTDRYILADFMLEEN